MCATTATWRLLKNNFSISIAFKIPLNVAYDTWHMEYSVLNSRWLFSSFKILLPAQGAPA